MEHGALHESSQRRDARLACPRPRRSGRFWQPGAVVEGPTSCSTERGAGELAARPDPVHGPSARTKPIKAPRETRRGETLSRPDFLVGKAISSPLLSRPDAFIIASKVMKNPAASQWDFGELFPPQATRRVFTVTELTVTVKRLVERELGQIWVTGEITNLRVQSSGHAYFAVKDAGAQLSCVLFRSDARAVDRGLLRDGQMVVLQGELTVYEARGQYQLRVTSVELQGVGALQLAFARLKEKLLAEGLFAAERKRPLPRFPQCIGVVTSPTGAAFQDVLHVIQRRNPGLEIMLAPCRVQGQGAAEEIAAAIRMLNRWHHDQPETAQRLDLILVTRGGGSMEDLWAFNEEGLARAIFDSALPVVSAVGHEIDFTMSDFVADVRAATPSVAAELITEGVFASREFIEDLPGRLRSLLADRLEALREEIERWHQRLNRVHPRQRLREWSQHLDDLESALVRCVTSSYRTRLTAWDVLCQRLVRVRPAQVLSRRQEQLASLHARLTEKTRLRLRERLARLAEAQARLRLLSPDNVLERGYSITSDAETGRLIRAASDVRAGQRLRTRVHTGEIRSVVEESP